MIFSKNYNNNVMVTAILYYPGINVFRIIESHVMPQPQQHVRDAVTPTIMCAYRYPTGDYGATDLREQMDEYRVEGTDMYEEVPRCMIFELYTNWRRAGASGYDCSRIFNYYGVRLPNPLIRAESQPTFDIRLGHYIMEDVLARDLIGNSVLPYSPRR